MSYYTTKFVVNTIARVENLPEEDFENDSGDEELDETFETYEDDPPYIDKNFKKVYIEEKNIHYFEDDVLSKLKSKQYNSKIVGPLLEKLTKQAFQVGDNTAKNNISACIYLNKMKSVSERRNYSLYFEISCKHIQDLEFKIFANFWCCIWRNKTNCYLSYEEVRKYYKQLKRKDKDRAKQFLRDTENKKEIEEIIPYQHLREKIKNHQFTKELVLNFRNQNENVNIYLSIIDADTIDFNGIYDTYTSEISNYSQEELPRVISTGYIFPKENYPVYAASEFDRQIRIKIAKYFPLGMYYPEPNICILIPKNCLTVPESFVDKNKGKNKLESPVLLRNIIQTARNNNKEVKCVFFDGKPLITTTPSRLKNLDFSSEFKYGAPPTSNDIKKFKQLTQSSYNDLNCFRNLFINGAVTLINNIEQHITDEILRYECKNLVDQYKNISLYEQIKVQMNLLSYIDNYTVKAVTKTWALQHCMKLISQIRKNIDANEINITELQDYISPEMVNAIIRAIDSREKYIKKYKSEELRTEDDDILLNLLTSRKINISNFIEIIEKQNCKFKDAVTVMNKIHEKYTVYDPEKILIFVKPNLIKLIDENLLHVHKFIKLDINVLQFYFSNNNVIKALATKLMIK